MIKVQQKHTLFILILSCFIVAILFLVAATPALASGVDDDLSGLIEDVEALIEAGSINHGNGNALIAKLEAAQKSMVNAKENAAVNQLEAFKNQVDDFIQSAKLSPSVGQSLIDEAAYIQAVISCTDPLGCVTLRVGEPIRLASALAISGPIAPVGIDSQRGIEIALDLQGDLYGHPLELRAEDAGCSSEGGEAVANLLITDPKVTAIVGTSCTGAAVTAAPIISDAGYVMVSPSNTAPVLTNPLYHPVGYLRTAHNDKYQGVAMANYVWSLGAESSAVITRDDPYTIGLGAVFVETFLAAGGENIAFETFAMDSLEVAAALDVIAAVGPPDVLYMPAFIEDGVEIATQVRERPEFEDTILASADGIASFDFLIGAGAAAEGILISLPNLDFSDNTLYTEVLLPAYIEAYGDPPAPFHAHAFDAANMVIAGIEAVAVEDEGTLQIGRQALRDALFATREMAGATGTISCDEYGDCADAKFVIWSVIDGFPVVVWP